MSFMNRNKCRLSLVCVILTLHLDYWRTEARAQSAGQPPAQWTWKTERVELDPGGETDTVEAYTLQSLREGDAVLVKHDIPRDKFPFHLRKLNVGCQVTSGTHFALIVKPLIYDGTMNLRYTSKEFALRSGWMNEVPLTDTFDEVRKISAPIVLDENSGPNIYIRLEIVGMIDAPMSDSGPTLMIAKTGIFPDFNWWVHQGALYEMQALPTPGNVCVRSIFDCDCPKAVGDLDGDRDIDNDDLAVLQAAIAAPGDMFLDLNRRRCDLNNDWRLDSADVAILMANLTGSGVKVVCPAIEVMEPVINRTFTVGATPPADVFQVRNSGGGQLNFQVSPKTSWLTITPAQGSSSGEVQSMSLQFSTQNLQVGSYQGSIWVDGNSANSPQIVPVNVNIWAEGDFDLDGDVDLEDIRIFGVCAAGPNVRYTPGLVPAGCQMQLRSDGTLRGDFDRDIDIDSVDFAEMQRLTKPGTGAGMSSNLQAQAAESRPVWANVPESSRTLPVAKDGKTVEAQHVVMAYQWLFGLVLLLFLLIIAIIYFRSAQQSQFISAGKAPNSTEGVRIRAAINYLKDLSNKPGAHGDFKKAYDHLKNEQWYYADSCGCSMLLINRKPVGDGKDETGEEGTVASVVRSACKICIRQDMVDHPNWTDLDTKRLAICLFAEWEHFYYQQSNENAMQTVFETTMNTTQETKDLMRQINFHHGVNETNE